MKLLQIRVESFGKLKALTLEPSAGLNRYCHPNEFGKSTLMAFICFIFYGYDSKWMKSYFPWEGGPLSGSIIFSLGEKQYQIFRHHPEKGAEKQQLLELSSGKEIPLAAKERPGPKLFGLDGKTFMRTFFVQQGELLFKRTDGLDTALKNLAATGDENASFQQAREYLQKEHSRYMYRGRAQGPLLDLQTALLEKRETLRGLEQQIEAKIAEKAQLEALEQEKAALEAKLSAIERRLNQAKKNDAARRLERMEQLARSEAAKPRSEAEDSLLSEQEQAYLQLAEAEAAVEEQKRIGQGIERERQGEQHRLESVYLPADTGERLARFEKGNRGSLIFGIILWILAAAAVGGSLLWSPLLWIAVALLGGAAVFFCIKEPMEKRQFCHHCGVADLAALKERWNQYQQAKERLSALQLEREAQLLALQRAEQEQGAQKEALAALTLQTRLLTLEELRQEQFDRAVHRQTAENLQQQKEALLKGRSLEEWRSAAEGGDAKGESHEQVFAEKQAALSALQRVLDQLSGKDLSALASLWKEAEALRAEIAADQNREQEWKRALAAARYSLQWLEEANEDMARHFAPRLCKGAGELLAMLTDGAYSGLQMDKEYNIRLETAAGAYPLDHFSGGTKDAVYFAFRLAAGALISEVQLPLLLDDPFVNLDDERLSRAEKLLAVAAKERQILYFTCREQ